MEEPHNMAGTSIEEIILRDYPAEEQAAVREQLAEIRAGWYGAGSDRLARTLLLIASGSLRKLRRLFPISDPRDLFMEAGRMPLEKQALYLTEKDEESEEEEASGSAVDEEA